MSTVRRIAKNTAVLTLADIINKILSMVYFQDFLKEEIKNENKGFYMVKKYC